MATNPPLFVICQILQLNALFLALLSMTTPMALRALYGPLPFYLVFLAIVAFKVIINVKTINVIWFIKVSKVISVFKIIFQVTFFSSSGDLFFLFR